ncbi:hypothetical protein BU14_0060s0009 [Porphyra umbilicalis]|uniref:Uncharacterized protein n=1 Tax=Porphyra umbilicalis TaxID=2786 RepID=A0A1X6PGT6_PORUM|nr:hypothetical protein BU14_0060s0009 [Porphyra umbilicalis]|eukprot:OSX80042.1 hypothetical protein BU14_0060s0009 [Porphyra umbilicalis]
MLTEVNHASSEGSSFSPNTCQWSVHESIICGVCYFDVFFYRGATNVRFS